MNKTQILIISLAIASALTFLMLIAHAISVTISTLQGEIDFFNLNDVAFLKAIGIGVALVGLFALFFGYRCLIIKGRSEHLTSEKKFGLGQKLFWTFFWMAMMAVGWLGMRMRNLPMSFFVVWVVINSSWILWVVYKLNKQKDKKPKDV